MNTVRLTFSHNGNAISVPQHLFAVAMGTASVGLQARQHDLEQSVSKIDISSGNYESANSEFAATVRSHGDAGRALSMIDALNQAASDPQLSMPDASALKGGTQLRVNALRALADAIEADELRDLPVPAHLVTEAINATGANIRIKQMRDTLILATSWARERMGNAELSAAAAGNGPDWFTAATNLIR